LLLSSHILHKKCNFVYSHFVMSSAPLHIIDCMWENNNMPRWSHFLIAVTLGIAAGLLYGWVIAPLEYTDLTPDTLRADYRSDYVLMVAEAYHAEQNTEPAARRLAILGSRPPAEIIMEAYNYAHQSSYPEGELALLQELALALKDWHFDSGGNPP